MITAKQCSDRWVEGSGTSKFDYEVYARSSAHWAKGWEAVAALANQAEKPVVPRMIHEAFWKTYFQWADGLEKVLRSEQLPEPLITGRLDLECAAAGKRLEHYIHIAPGDGGWKLSDCDPIKLVAGAKEAAIPARK